MNKQVSEATKRAESKRKGVACATSAGGDL